MGKVRMTEYNNLPNFQETIEYSVDYTYCDKCGSFDVKRSSRLPSGIENALLIVFLISLVAAFILLVIRSYLGCLVAGLVGVTAVIVVMRTSLLQCRKCGNTEITSDNVLHYSEGDESVIDVPLASIVREVVARND